MSDAITKLKEAATRLQSRGLLHSGDSLSQRVVGTDWIIFLSLQTDQLNVITMPGSILDGLPHQELLSQHRAIYQHRKDVGAILLSSQPWAAALRDLNSGMPGVFDEQIRHLGSGVARLDIDVVRQEQCRLMDKGENAFVLDKNVLCLGMTLDRVVFNAELLEKCAKAFVLATSTGNPVGRIPWLVRWIANGRLMKDERYAAKQYALGRIPVFKSAY